MRSGRKHSWLMRVPISVLILLWFYFCMRAVLFADETATEQKTKNVLFISSYSESFETVDAQKEGICSVFGERVLMDIEYMNMKRFHTEENEEFFYQTLRYRLANSPEYDAVILGDDDALRFAQKHQEELFNGIPLVFFCINDKEYAEEMVKNENICGAVEEQYMQDTIELALTFQPDAHEILAINDDSVTGVGDEQNFYRYQQDYPQLTFSVLNFSEYSKEEFIEQLEQIPQNTIVFYLNMFYDRDGNYYTMSDSVNLLAKHTHIPVYRISVGGVGQGLIGGKMVSYKESGKVAAQLVLDIWNGMSMEQGMVLEGSSQYYLDYEVLKKYNIDPDLAPADTVWVNKPVPFYKKYRNEIGITWLSALIFGVIFGLLLLNNRRQKQFTNKLQANHDELTKTYEELMTTQEELQAQYELATEYLGEVEKQRDHIEHLADYDHLTNLPNRRYMMEELERILPACSSCAVIICDIDDFKVINDLFGHKYGDEILKALSERLLSIQDERNYIARFGGDEFLILLRNVELEGQHAFIQNMVKAFSKPFSISGKDAYVQVSIGVAAYPEHGTSVSELISHADMAMFTAKRMGKNVYKYYNTHMQDELNQKTGIENILRKAIAEDGFQVVYQPQIDVANGGIHCYEALVRLKEYSLSPAKFIPVAEESDLILDIGRIVTKKVVKQQALWRERGMEIKPVAINFSSKQIRDHDYLPFLLEQMKEENIPAEFIEIEITESIFLENNMDTNKLTDDFRRAGFKLALDDFGTGFSSISYLTYIPVSKVKLDKSFADKFLHDDSEATIESIISLSHSLGLRITVEGIEQIEQYQRLKSFHCDYIQGYLFSKPLFPDEVEKWSKTDFMKHVIEAVG